MIKMKWKRIGARVIKKLGVIYFAILVNWKYILGMRRTIEIELIEIKMRSGKVIKNSFPVIKVT